MQHNQAVCRYNNYNVTLNCTNYPKLLGHSTSDKCSIVNNSYCVLSTVLLIDNV